MSQPSKLSENAVAALWVVTQARSPKAMHEVLLLGKIQKQARGLIAPASPPCPECKVVKNEKFKGGTITMDPSEWRYIAEVVDDLLKAEKLQGINEGLMDLSGTFAAAKRKG